MISGELETKLSETSVGVPYSGTYWVIPKLLLAGEHPTELDDDETRARLSALLDAGVRTFVDLTETQEMKSYYRLLRSAAKARQTEILFRRIPIPDQEVPSPLTLLGILDLIDQSTKNQSPVFVHCFAGLGRTGTVVGCYLRRHGLAKQGEVVAQIARLRSRMPGWRGTSPQTTEQVHMVENWEDGA